MIEPTQWGEGDRFGGVNVADLDLEEVQRDLLSIGDPAADVAAEMLQRYRSFLAEPELAQTIEVKRVLKGRAAMLRERARHIKGGINDRVRRTVHNEVADLLVRYADRYPVESSPSVATRTDGATDEEAK